MRTTVTLDPDVEQLVRTRMVERQQSFKQALNEAIREGAAAHARPGPFTTRTFRMGPSRVDLDRAMQVVGELDDDEVLRRMTRGS